MMVRDRGMVQINASDLNESKAQNHRLGIQRTPSVMEPHALIKLCIEIVRWLVFCLTGLDIVIAKISEPSMVSYWVHTKSNL